MKHNHKRRKMRNPLANDPLLRKGGVHEKTHKAKRSLDKQALRKKVMNQGDSSPDLFSLAFSLAFCHA